jgi:putative addiction module killer protein
MSWVKVGLGAISLQKKFMGFRTFLLVSEPPEYSFYWRLTNCSQLATLTVVIEVRRTDVFAEWLDDLRDLRARARVQARIERLALGNPGDVRPVGEGVSELRIDQGPGYRVYFVHRGKTLIILLAGGDKSTQAKDIETALRLARNLKEIPHE